MAPRPDRRAQIVAGLRTVLADHGYDRASIHKIAAAADLTPGLVHYHFGSKAEILIALIDQLVHDAWARVHACMAEATTPRERLGALVDGLLAAEDPDPAAVACWVQLGADAVRLPTIRPAYQAFVHELARRLRTLLADALLDEGRSTAQLGALAAGLTATIEGFLHVATAAPGTIPPGSAAPTARAMAFGLLDAQPRPPAAR